MNRYEEIKRIADRYYNTIENDENRSCCFAHSEAVAACAKEIAEIEAYNPELVQIAGYLHDCAQYLEHGHNHAFRSSIIARDILVSSALFSTEEIHRIMNSIARHSDKKRIDGVCDEILKNADLLAKYRSDELLSLAELERIRNYI